MLLCIFCCPCMYAGASLIHETLMLRINTCYFLCMQVWLLAIHIIIIRLWSTLLWVKHLLDWDYGPDLSFTIRFLT